MSVLAGRKPTLAGVIAVGALVCAMGGTAVAAAHQDGNKLIAKHSLSGNRLKDNTVSGKQLKDLVWHDLTLENGWTAFDSGVDYAETPQYAKDAAGFIHLRGTFRGAAKTSNTFANIPAGFRSDVGHQWLAVGATDGDFGILAANLDVSSNGDLAIYEPSGANYAFVSLDGVEYVAG